MKTQFGVGQPVTRFEDPRLLRGAFGWASGLRASGGTSMARPDFLSDLLQLQENVKAGTEAVRAKQAGQPHDEAAGMAIQLLTTAVLARGGAAGVAHEVYHVFDEAGIKIFG